jgi:DNA-binding GntR family transcriptional regulator
MQQAYDEIKRRIVVLELQPGQRLDDYDLSVELELSRTPVREAIFRLAAEGLVDIRSNAGFIVRPLDLLDIANLFEAHIVVGKAVARLAARRVQPEELARMRELVEAVEEAIERRDYLAMTSRNADLHRLEAAATKNRHLREMADSIHDQGQRLAYLCFGGAGGDEHRLAEHFERVRAHHRQMLAALEAGDAEAAERIVTAHVALFRKRVQTYLESEAIEGFEVSDDDLAVAALERNGGDARRPAQR